LRWLSRPWAGSPLRCPSGASGFFAGVGPVAADLRVKHYARSQHHQRRWISGGSALALDFSTPNLSVPQYAVPVGPFGSACASGLATARTFSSGENWEGLRKVAIHMAGEFELFLKLPHDCSPP
jgi:hypothetical protein